MRFKQSKPVQHKTSYRLYSPTSLSKALSSVKDYKTPVATAAKKFNVPVTTLRDRVNGKIDIDCVTTGREPVLSLEEEAKVVNHLKSVANYGYGYTRQEVVDIASDYATSLGKRPCSKPLTLNWFTSFAKRWPEIRVIKPRALEVQRAKGASVGIVDAYFNRLDETIRKYGLSDKPHLIFNVDEKGISQDHSPPYVVSGRNFHPQCVTSGKSKTTTILGCGSASGVAIPPYFVFAGKRLLPDLLKDCIPNAAADMSDNGWSNTDIFRKYLQEHFLKFIPRREPGQHILLLLDGHKTHISLDLIEWAKQHNIVLFILPAHTSHVLQPLDVACYGPLQRIYNNECHKQLRASSASVITRYEVASLACKAYSKALSPETLRSAFCKAGIYPFSRSAIDAHSLQPSEVFSPVNCNTDASVETQEVPSTQQNDKSTGSPSAFMDEKLEKLKKTKSSVTQKEHKSISKFVSGQAVTESPIKNQIVKHVLENQPKSNATKRKGKSSSVVKPKKQRKVSTLDSPQPGPSCYHVSSEPSIYNSSSEDEDESTKCCVCNLFTPVVVRQSVSLIFVKWVQCDSCPHWVHIPYCTKQSVIRRGDTFKCPHC